MKKLLMLAAAFMLLPVLANAQTMEGDPGFFFGFEFSEADVILGEVYCDYPAPTNFGFLGGLCPGEDTFCVTTSDDLDWVQTGGVTSSGVFIANGECFILGPGYWYSGWELCIAVPCDASVDDVNVWTAVMSYCNDAGECVPESGDCEDPNVYSGNHYSTISITLTVVESPPALFVLQDSLYFVEQGAAAAYVPFSICNGDPCAPATDYEYAITSNGTIGAPIDTTGSALGILGGLCGDVYAVIDAGAAALEDEDILTIVAWDAATGTVYDTCVQIVQIVEPVPVPLFTTPVVTILVLAMILAAAVIMKRTAASKA